MSRIVIGIVMLTASAVQAQSALERAVDAYESGDIEAATAALRLVPDDSLTRPDVVRWLTYRALVAHVSGDDAEVEAALLQLATLGEENPLGRLAPPAVVAVYESALERVNAELTITVRTTEAAGGVGVRATVEHDLGALTERIRVRARIVGGEWVRGEGRVFVPVTHGRLEVVAEALGPGGAVMARHGSDAEPRSVTVGDVALEPEPDQPDPGVAPPPRQTGKIVGITIAIVAALAGAAVLTYFLVGDDDAGHDIGPPVVVFP